MAITRCLMRRVALVLLCALVSGQWATAAYVCPRSGGEAAQAMAAMPDCAGMTAEVMDPEQPQLCKAHCEQGAQSVNATPSPEPATSFSVLAVLDWRAGAALPLHGSLPAARERASAQPPPGTPPIYLTLRVLRD